MKHEFYEAIEKRRSIYALSKESTISDDRIRDVVEHSLNHTPSAFNSQSGRAVTLLGKDHDELWHMTESALKRIMPEEGFGATKEKLDAFRNAYGTVVFFEDSNVVEDLQDSFPLYRDNFPIWSQQASGMLQHNVWTSFAVEGLGASLQHYNELIEEDVKKKWDIPDNWKMMSQMPFGKPLAEPGEKAFADIKEKHIVHNSK